MRGIKESIEAIHYTISLLKNRAGIIVPVPVIKWDLRGVTAGRAWVRKNIIQLNPILCSENPEAFVARTPGHEVVHMAVAIKYGGAVGGHGPEWKKLMRLCDLPDTRCHNYDTATVTGRRSVPLTTQIIPQLGEE